MTDLNTLYQVIKKFALERDTYLDRTDMTAQLWAEMTDAEKEAHIKKIFDLNNKLVTDSIAEYKQRGGKRDVNKFIRLPMV